MRNITILISTFMLVLTIACKKGKSSTSAGSASSLCEAAAENQKQFSAANLAGTYSGKNVEGKPVKFVITANDALAGTFSVDGKDIKVTKLTYSCTMFMMTIKTEGGMF